ncbi:MAG: DUF4878 domain-containing protein [Muribaculaceae bacterium]|nr:DUF4878 domain-containing protein [Muribaculaceae bacterium]
MKKLFFALVCMFAAMVVTSCGGSATPADAAADCIELMKAQDFEGIVESMYFGDITAEEQAQAKEMYVAMFNEKGAKQLEKLGGISSYALVSEEIAEDGQTAVVKYDITYGDGSVKNQKFNMVLVDGEWKQSAKK